MLRVPHPCGFCKGGYDAADAILAFSREAPSRMRSRYPPFAKYAKDRAPIVLVTPARSKARATRPRIVAVCELFGMRHYGSAKLVLVRPFQSFSDLVDTN
jgi:hypothetical protein